MLIDLISIHYYFYIHLISPQTNMVHNHSFRDTKDSCKSVVSPESHTDPNKENSPPSSILSATKES